MSTITTGPDPTKVVGRRVVAWILDDLLAAVGYAIVASIFGLTRVPSTGPGSDAYNTWLVQALFAQLVWVGVVFVIRGALVGLYGWSPGKLLLGLRVVDFDGRPPGLAKGYVRELVNTLGTGLFGCFYDLPAFIIANNSAGHRQPADMAAQTYVIDSYYFGRLIIVRSGKAGAGPPSVKREEVEGLLRQSGVPDSFIPPHGKITEPFFEKSLGTYVVYNVKRGAWLRFDKATKTWSPIDPNAAAAPNQPPSQPTGQPTGPWDQPPSTWS
jgi:uncharacterized RDD family membrane protein YckC